MGNEERERERASHCLRESHSKSFTVGSTFHLLPIPQGEKEEVKEGETENNCPLGREREGHRLLWLFGQLWAKEDEESSLLCSPSQPHSEHFSIIETDAGSMGEEYNTNTMCGRSLLHHKLVLSESLRIFV